VIVTEIARVALREMGLDWTVSGVRDNPVWDLTTDHTAIENPTTVWNYTELGVKLGEYTVDLVAALEALVESGDAKIRANPRITTVSGHTAEISMTKDQYFILQTGATQYYQYNVLQAVSTGITLEITPYTSASGEIMVYVKPTVGDVVGKGENDLPEISTRGAKTSVRVMDGETFTIGGLSLQQEKNVKRKIPILGDIPLLGYLFRYDRVETRDTEVVIFVTPHILQM
jgi:type II secretory pathway component GspD/PulD (secretin)